MSGRRRRGCTPAGTCRARCWSGSWTPSAATGCCRSGDTCKKNCRPERAKAALRAKTGRAAARPKARPSGPPGREVGPGRALASARQRRLARSGGPSEAGVMTPEPAATHHRDRFPAEEPDLDRAMGASAPRPSWRAPIPPCIGPRRGAGSGGRTDFPTSHPVGRSSKRRRTTARGPLRPAGPEARKRWSRVPRATSLPREEPRLAHAAARPPHG